MSYSKIRTFNVDDVIGSTEQVHFSHEMGRLVNTLEATASSFVTIYADSQQRAQDFKEKNAKDAIASAEKSARLESRKMRHAVIGLSMSIVVAAIGLIGSGINEKTKHERTVEAAEFQRRLNKLDDISAAMTELRKVKENARVDCGTADYDRKAVEHKRVDARHELIKKCRNADYYFGEDVYSAAKDYIWWESSFPDYCAKDLPDPEVWRMKQKIVEKLIRDTIHNPLTD
jgi:hypothetical protein